MRSRSNAIFRWIRWNIYRPASKACVCLQMMQHGVNWSERHSCRILRRTHMFSWIIIFPLKPSPESSRRNKQTDKQEKKFNYTLLANTRESVRLCAVSEQMLEWWMIHNSGGFKRRVGEVRMWCVVWNQTGRSHHAVYCLTWSHV